MKEKHEASRELHYNWEDLPERIIAAKTDCIRLRLPDFSSAGYQWHVEQTPECVIKMIEQKALNQSGVFGSGNIVIRFCALKNGYLRIYSKRSWEDVIYYEKLILLIAKEE